MKVVCHYKSFLELGDTVPRKIRSHLSQSCCEPSTFSYDTSEPFIQIEFKDLCHFQALCPLLFEMILIFIIWYLYSSLPTFCNDPPISSIHIGYQWLKMLRIQKSMQMDSNSILHHRNPIFLDEGSVSLQILSRVWRFGTM